MLNEALIKWRTEVLNAQHQEIMLNMSLPWVTFTRSPNHFIKIPVAIAFITEIGIFSAIVLFFSLEPVIRCGNKEHHG
jgi:hypothetical protein